MSKCNCASNDLKGGDISEDKKEGMIMLDSTHYILIGAIILLLLLIKLRC